MKGQPGTLDVLAVIRAPLEQYPPSLNQVGLLAEAGLKVGVVDCSRPDFALHAFRGPQPVRRLRPCKSTDLKQENLPGMAVRVWRAIRFRRCVLRVLQQYAPKVVVAYDPNAMAATGSLWKRKRRPKLVWHFHELCLQARKEGGMLNRWAIDFAYRHAAQADLITCPDKGRAGILAKAAGLERLPTVIMNCPRRTARVPPDALAGRLASRGKAGFRAVYFHGWIGPSRGLEKVIDSIRWWPEDAVFVAVGPVTGGYRECLLTASRQAGVEERVLVLGSVPYAEVLGLAAGATVGCSLVADQKDPNWIYSAGAINKRFEYMAAGLPQVTSDGPGVREIMEKNPCGLCVNPVSPEAIGAAVRQLLSDESQRRMYASNGRAAHLQLYNYETQFAEAGNWIRSACRA
jgi:glycosyltransferase involved in cell wall biosynthesis